MSDLSSLFEAISPLTHIQLAYIKKGKKTKTKPERGSSPSPVVCSSELKKFHCVTGSWEVKTQTARELCSTETLSDWTVQSVCAIVAGVGRGGAQWRVQRRREGKRVFWAQMFGSGSRGGLRRFDLTRLQTQVCVLLLAEQKVCFVPCA